MISVEQALEKILGHVTVLEVETSSILDCLGQVVAGDVRAAADVPPWDNSAMDGYAVRALDTGGASSDSPRILRVIDTVSAGSVSANEVGSSTAMRIMTGAPLPRGADAVVRFEDTDEGKRDGGIAEIGILKEVEPGADVRRAGEDIQRGEVALPSGTVIRPAEVGVLASLGQERVKVIRRPVVAILTTGDELVMAGEALTPGKIYDSNTYSLAALVRRYGGLPQILGIARDSEGSVTRGLRRGLEADMLLTTGGVSMGDYDLVKDVLAKEGEITFWTVRMKPGKPLAFGTIQGTTAGGVIKKIPHLGLPGNPVSVMITFELFARPAMLKMMGYQRWDKSSIEAEVEDRIMNRDGRRIYARAVVRRQAGKYFARLTGSQGSGILTSMSRANGLVVVPEDKPGVNPGDVVTVLLLEGNEGGIPGQ